ncbi:hypothetical protein [Pseudaminobacter soli (ex Li et al. 2025)]|uniref:Uncharacterized protein n=1 Tax=Pseudaminobacter soli (ex Li et al. 2025) TaxID=1295366 RepID=A0A2P7S0G1_9HYPH|nr:hypothetical protein [Mesorhizobium soli]PSJ55964.1 hypothetical protein C7I85_25880 [Mesorhizobium soli]
MQLTRLELYKRVCDRPLSKVAPELGISGTVLAAICKRYQIPYPGSGYWTRKSLGLPAELPTLPEASDETIEIMPSVAKPRKKRTLEEGSVRKPKPDAKLRRPARHPLLFGVEEHLRKTRDVKNGEFLRPYKRILPDLVSSETALLRALSTANDLYLALDEQGYRVHIAQAADNLHRIHVREQEVERKDRRYGRDHSGSIWAPDRPTVFYIDKVPIGLALTEMTERVTMRYLNGDYHREDSSLIRSAKSWQLTHSWTTEQDMPCGRFRIVAYSPKKGVDWSVSWQETEQQLLGTLIPRIVETLRASKNNLRRLMDAEDAAEAKRKREREEEWARYERREDARKTAQALTDSRQQLAEIIERWGRAMTVERFFADAEERLKNTNDERRQRLEERLTLARAMMESVDPLDFIEGWVAPEERHRPKFL